MHFCFIKNKKTCHLDEQIIFKWCLSFYIRMVIIIVCFPLDLQRNNLPCYRWDEGEGRQRRVLSLCCYVGGSGCGSEVQGAWDHRSAHQAEGHWWKQVSPWMHNPFTDKNSNITCMSCAQCSCGSVVEHCVSSARGCGFSCQETHILTKKCIAWMH